MPDNDKTPQTHPKFKKQRRRGVAQKCQAADIQRFAYDCIISLQKSCTSATGEVVVDKETANAVQKLIASWDTAADRNRILRGKGLPSSYKPAKDKAKAFRPVEAPQ